jgi:hypothetical protein
LASSVLPSLLIDTLARLTPALSMADDFWALLFKRNPDKRINNSDIFFINSTVLFRKAIMAKSLPNLI